MQYRQTRLKQNESLFPLRHHKNLYIQAKRWQRARFIRDYLIAFKENAVQQDQLSDDLSNWLQWANDKVDWYDPLINRQDKLLDFFDKDNLVSFTNYSRDS